MTNRIQVSALSVLLAAAAPLGRAEPPSEWKAIFRESAQSVWDNCFEQDRFYSTRLLATFRQLGSQHDGDRQYEVARLLGQVEHDPHAGLLHYLRSPDPYDRAFAIQVINHLGDRRFAAPLKALSKDSASLNKWDILPYKDVGGAARLALEHLQAGRDDLQLKTPFPKWLKAARELEMK